MKKSWLIIVIVLVFVSACSSGPSTTPTSEIEPIKPPLPTHTSAPPEPTPTTNPILFLDEFDGDIDLAWTWENENPEKWSISPEGWLAITASNPSLLASEQQIQQVNLLVQPAPKGDLVITTRLVADPDENFQQAGIFLLLDGQNYVAILNAFCEFCLPDSGGYGIFMEGYKNGDQTANQLFLPRPADQTDVYLRLVFSSSQNMVTGLYTDQDASWKEIGVVTEIPAFNQVALGAANAPGPDGITEDLVTFFDYFEIATVETQVRTGAPLPQLTNTPEPTNTAEPTATNEPTPLPEGVLFRDDFEGYLQQGWEWINENPEKWTFVDYNNSTWLQIIGDKPGGLAEQSNTLMRPLPDGDFVLTAHIIADPRENHHQANIFIFEDESNFIRLNFGFCDHCNLPESGHGFFMETIIENNPFGDFYAIQRDPEATDVYLQLVNQGGSITGYYATEFGNWQRIGAFGNYFAFVSVGLGATNSVPQDWEVEDIEALFDYFEISLPE